MSDHQAAEPTAAAPPEGTFESPFDGMSIASHEPLRSATRSVCGTCRRKRRYFCYTCMSPMTAGVPRVALPIRADIVHHPAEHLAKSTSVHGAVLSPDFVRVVEFIPQQMPEYDRSATVLLYPAPGSMSLRDIPRPEFDRIDRVVLLDSQWQRAGSMFRHPAIASLRPVRISTARTAFWRYQSFGSDHLSTVEALYHFMKEFHEVKTGRPYAGEFDNLLFYFSFMHKLIQEHYRSNPDIKFNHIADYIDYGDAPPDPKKGGER